MKRLSIFFFLAGAACSSTPGTGTDAATDKGTGDETSMDDGGGPSMCTAALDMVLKPIDMVSNGSVMVIGNTNGVRTIYVDASAGGSMNADTNPRTYINLESGTRVDVTDPASRMSTMWDLALKRYYIFTNSADAGPGMGGSLYVAKAFDQVTAADATGKPLATEHFVDDVCMPQMDATGGLLTTFDSWYDYDQMTHIPTPKANVTYIVRGATGKMWKVAILSYASSPDGGQGMATGFFSLKVAAL
jgi:hypothetical protein